MSFVPNQTCTVAYTFTPTRPRMRYGGVQLLNSAGSIVSSTYLSGMGNGAQTTFALSTSTVPILPGSSFADPQGMALDGYGNVYVVDLGKHAVYEILAAGGYTTIKTLGGGFIYPAGIAVDGIGNVYVSDEGTSIGSEMPPGCASSSCVTAIGGGFRHGLALAVDGIGNVYVADIAATVARIPPGCLSSSCVTTVGGGFVLPYGVAVDAGGNVYVADRQNHQVMVMPADCASAQADQKSEHRKA